MADLRARLSDFELMAKYQLSLHQLQHVIKKLVNSGRIRGAEIKERASFFDEPANRLQTRRFPREYLRIPLEIQDLADPSKRGFVIDLSRDGFRTRGMPAAVGEEKGFVVHWSESQNTIELKPNVSGSHQALNQTSLFEAGFKIVQVSDGDLSEMRRLIRLLSLGDRNVHASDESALIIMGNPPALPGGYPLLLSDGQIPYQQWQRSPP